MSIKCNNYYYRLAIYWNQMPIWWNVTHDYILWSLHTYINHLLYLHQKYLMSSKTCQNNIYIVTYTVHLTWHYLIYGPSLLYITNTTHSLTKYLEHLVSISYIWHQNSVKDIQFLNQLCYIILKLYRTNF